jgi:hypothetical protein
MDGRYTRYRYKNRPNFLPVLSVLIIIVDNKSGAHKSAAFIIENKLIHVFGWIAVQRR